MKVMTICISMLILTVGCMFAQAQTQPANIPLKGKVTKRELPDAVRKNLGVSQEDLVIALKGDGSKIIYEATGKKAKVVEDSQLPQYKLQHAIVIYGLQNSPTCYYYWDNNGNKVWYPSGCPN